MHIVCLISIVCDSCIYGGATAVACSALSLHQMCMVHVARVNAHIEYSALYISHLSHMNAHMEYSALSLQQT